MTHLFQESGIGPVGFPAYDEFTSSTKSSKRSHGSKETRTRTVLSTTQMFQPTVEPWLGVHQHKLTPIHAHVYAANGATSTYPWLLKCLFSKGESSLELMTLCHVGTGSMSRRTYTLFTPAPEKGKRSYLSIYLQCICALPISKWVDDWDFIPEAKPPIKHVSTRKSKTLQNPQFEVMIIVTY